MKEQVPRELLEMSQEDVRDWLYSDLDEIIDTEYPDDCENLKSALLDIDQPIEKGGAE